MKKFDGEFRVHIAYGKRKHCGGLDDSLKTAVKISKTEFEQLVKRYHFYAFDDRVNQILFLADDMQKEEFAWLYLEIDKLTLSVLLVDYVLHGSD